MLAGHIRRGEEIPHPKACRGARYRLIVLPVLEAASVELYGVFQESGKRKPDIEAIFAALDKLVDIEVRDAASRLFSSL